MYCILQANYDYYNYQARSDVEYSEYYDYEDETDSEEGTEYNDYNERDSEGGTTTTLINRASQQSDPNEISNKELEGKCYSREQLLYFCDLSVCYVIY